MVFNDKTSKVTFLEWNRAIVFSNYRFFVENRKTPFRREDFLEENAEMARELDQEMKTPAGFDKSHREEAESFNRGDGDGKRPPQDLSQDWSKAQSEIKPTGPRNLDEAAPKKDAQETTFRPSKSDSMKDWEKIAGHEKSGSRTEHFTMKDNKVAEKFQESFQDVKEGAQKLTSKIVHKGEELLGSAKETIKNVADKLKH